MRDKQGIKPVAALFEKYTKLLIAPQSTVVTTVIEVVEDVCGFTIEKRSVRYSPQTKIVTLQIPGPQKTEIMLRKTEILTHVEGRVGSKNAPKSIL